MNETVAGILLIAAPLWFNLTFAALAKMFDYPDILRRPTAEILERFRSGGSRLILTWWGFMMSGLLFVAAAILLSLVLGSEHPTLAALAATVGVLAGLVQVIGLLRWVYLVPALARMDADPMATPEARAAIAVTFNAFHRFFGVGIGEHLGYLLTGSWTLLIGAAVAAGTAVPAWLGWIAFPIGLGLVVASVEFLGPNEEHGWSLAGAAVPVLYIAWSLWLLGVGVTLIA